jgi:hypothetical protein
MNGWDAVFFPPSREFADHTAHTLRTLKVAGRIGPLRAKDLVARMYGYKDWSDLLENISTEPLLCYRLGR